MENNIVYLFQEPRVFEKKNTETNETEFRFIVDRAFRFTDDPNDYLNIALGDDDGAREYPVDLDDTNIDKKTGDITFSVFDGDYIIRKLKPEDGKWVSRLKMDIPVKALEYMLNPDERRTPMAENRELLTAYSRDDKSGPIFGVEYLNSNLGSFIRSNGLWILLSPEDETFDDMYITVIDPEKADKFLEAFDKGGMTVEEADTYADPSPEYQV